MGPLTENKGSSKYVHKCQNNRTTYTQKKTKKKYSRIYPVC